jgi:hypothetical protein
MQKRAGLWIDHEEAVMVFLSEEGEETHLVTSRSRASPPSAGRYYDEVVARLADAWAVLIFGIGEATREVAARLDGQGRSDRIIGVATAERMTASEIASEVRGRFRA